MNISSIILKINTERFKEISQEISHIKGVEIALTQGETIIATIEAKDSHEEISAFKEVEKISGVLSVSMHYCHYEDDGEKPLSNKGILDYLQELESDKNIRYKGDVDNWLQK